MDDSGRRCRDTFRAEFDEILTREEIYWKQSSWEKWLKKGDKKTAYFQGIASRQRRINHIACIKVGHKRDAKVFYSKLFIEEQMCRLDIGDDLFP